MTDFEQLCSWPNLLAAWHAAARGKRGHADVAAFEYRLEENLLALQTELRARLYRPGPYTSFHIHEPKRRLISAAPFRDRVVHHALCQIIEPAFERSFIADSFANRVGKGTHRALDHLQRLTRRFRFALPCDLRQFFPSLDHEILFDTLARKVSDDEVLRLIRLILRSGVGVLREEYTMVWFPGDHLQASSSHFDSGHCLFHACSPGFSRWPCEDRLKPGLHTCQNENCCLEAATRPRGLPIGNLTSQFWANCYLNPFDHFVKRELRCPGYVRSVDDFVLFADDKRTLWEWKTRLVERLARLRLTIHPGAHPRPVTEGIPFLGFIVYPHRRRLKRRKGIHFARKLRGLVAVEAGTRDLSDLTASIRSWAEHLRHGNTVGLRKAILGKIRLKPPRPGPA